MTWKPGDRVVVTNPSPHSGAAWCGDTGTVKTLCRDGVLTVSLDRGKIRGQSWEPLTQYVYDTCVKRLEPFWVCLVHEENQTLYLSKHYNEWDLTDNLAIAWRYESEAAAKRSAPRTWCCKDAKEDGGTLSYRQARSVGPDRRGGEAIELLTILDKLAGI